MTDLKLLREKIEDSGMTIVAISSKTGIDRATFYNRLKGKGEFTASEIVSLTSVLRLNRSDRDKIFLSSSVNNIH
jgi:predicted transcriptional regulator